MMLSAFLLLMLCSVNVMRCEPNWIVSTNDHTREHQREGVYYTELERNDNGIPIQLIEMSGRSRIYMELIVVEADQNASMETASYLDMVEYFCSSVDIVDPFPRRAARSPSRLRVKRFFPLIMPIGAAVVIPLTGLGMGTVALHEASTLQEAFNAANNNDVTSVWKSLRDINEMLKRRRIIDNILRSFHSELIGMRDAHRMPFSHKLRNNSYILHSSIARQLWASGELKYSQVISDQALLGISSARLAGCSADRKTLRIEVTIPTAVHVVNLYNVYDGGSHENACQRYHLPVHQVALNENDKPLGRVWAGGLSPPSKIETLDTYVGVYSHLLLEMPYNIDDGSEDDQRRSGYIIDCATHDEPIKSRYIGGGDYLLWVYRDRSLSVFESFDGGRILCDKERMQWTGNSYNFQPGSPKRLHLEPHEAIAFVLKHNGRAELRCIGALEFLVLNMGDVKRTDNSSTLSDDLKMDVNREEYTQHLKEKGTWQRVGDSFKDLLDTIKESWQVIVFSVAAFLLFLILRVLLNFLRKSCQSEM